MVCMAGLSDKQRVFCRLIAVEKLGRGEAYAQAFGCKANSAATLAGRLLKKVEVLEEIQRLSAGVKRRVEAVGVWSKVERMERLQEWAQRCAEAGDVGTAIRAVAEMNKMDGAYVQPEGTQVNVVQGVSVGEVVRAVLADGRGGGCIE